MGIFIMSECVFIIDMHLSSFAIASRSIFRQAIIACMSDADIFIFVIIAVQVEFFIMSSLDMPMHELIICWSDADIFMAGSASGALVQPTPVSAINAPAKTIGKIDFMQSSLGASGYPRQRGALRLQASIRLSRRPTALCAASNRCANIRTTLAHRDFPKMPGRFAHAPARVDLSR
jgi:hypothetical protein